jgi:hypothetical protein
MLLLSAPWTASRNRRKAACPKPMFVGAAANVHPFQVHWNPQANPAKSYTGPVNDYLYRPPSLPSKRPFLTFGYISIRISALDSSVSHSHDIDIPLHVHQAVTAPRFPLLVIWVTRQLKRMSIYHRRQCRHALDGSQAEWC